MPDGHIATAIYIASPEGDTGKSTIALGILHQLTAMVPRVGVFRPITRLVKGHDRSDAPDASDSRDYILELLLAHTSAGLSYDQCVGVDYQRLHADPDGAIADIVDRFHRVAAQCDAVLIVGSDYTDVASPSELSMNARIAVNLGAPVVLSVRAKRRTPEEVGQVVEVCLAELAGQHAHTAAIVANRCEPAQLTEVAAELARFAPKSYVLPDEPLLFAPSVADLQDAVGGTLVQGDPALLGREALGVLVAGMTAEHVLERLTDGVAVITPGDRSDVVLAVMSAHAAEGFPSLSTVILNGGLPLHPSITALVEGLGLRLPIITTDLGTFETASAVAGTRGRVTVSSQRKIDTALTLMERYVDAADLLAQLAIPIPTVTTPQMFEYLLLERARTDRKRIVLPEGDDDRILRAAGRLLQREVADLTILGDEAAVRARAAELGVDLSAATVLNPRTSELCDQFAQQYAQLRAKKGVTVEQAREIIHDVSYFGTMLVHNDLVDGMVSGAAHTTAHTVRPAFEIIKTRPDVATVSSIFLMCLADRVLAYGDCAIVVDPTSEQLADIAISSARTAAQFGIEPRVAMLSYSTGSSGTGVDVDKVRTATELVRERAPELLVEGPIQYDAAVEPSVAASKMPDSAVAGRATVLIFPDLNTGNNTYKAVQRSAGAVAVGPVLQGLNKPVNDLSRGALVSDIVNTVAITAIQAQGVNDVQQPTVLVLNSGSSSVKYQLIEPDSGISRAHGVVERIGDEQSSATLTINGQTLTREGAIRDHDAALRTVFELFAEAGAQLEDAGLVAVGHRVVHGGREFYQPTIIGDALLARLEELSPLAPLHNPPAILGIEVARRILSGVPHIAVFDTAFFHDLPAAAATYAIDREVAETWRIRRYGFHGTSHHYVSEQAAAFLGVPVESLNQIVLHLGNGASASAIAGGRPVDTSMGMTPMEGLVMGTRAGDIDPGIVFYLARSAQLSNAEIESMLNRRSGVYGLSGETDFRELHRLIAAGDEHAQTAYDVYIHRLRKYVGAYLAVLGNTDVITFTAGVGENDGVVRRDALTGLALLGIELDEHLNESPARGPRVISADKSPVTVLVIPTNEELAIARACRGVLSI